MMPATMMATLSYYIDISYYFSLILFIIDNSQIHARYNIINTFIIGQHFDEPSRPDLELATEDMTPLYYTYYFGQL